MLNIFLTQIHVMALIVMSLINLPVMAASPSAYSIQALIPDNQVDNELTYFDLMVTPGDRQIIQVAITNSEEQEIEAHVRLYSSSTAQNGLIVYDDPVPRDESLTLAVTDFSKVLTPDFLIPAGETAIAEILLDVPDQSFDGVILGGISVTTDYVTEQPAQPQHDGFQIENRYAYVIGLKIRETPENAEAAPDFHLKYIKPGLVNHRPVLLVNLQQSEPFIANHLEVSAKVTKSDESGFIRQLNLDSVQMAPNSNGDFVIDWTSPVAPGTYHLFMQVEREEHIWEWSEEFSIGGDTAAQINEGSVIEQKGAIPVWIIIVLVILLILVILLLILFLQKKKKKKHQSTIH